MTTLIIRMQVKPEKESRFLEIVNEIVGAMKTTEPETRIYAFWRTQVPYEYFMIESYTTASALEFHIGQHIGYQKEFSTCLSAPPQTEQLGDFVTGYPDETTLPLV